MEYVLSSRCGYRKFYVIADSKEQAIQRFDDAARQGLTNGFTSEKLPLVFENKPEIDTWEKAYQNAREI